MTDNQKKASEEISIDNFSILIQRRRLFWLLFSAIMTVAVLFIFSLPNIYQSTARLYFPEKSNSTSAIVSQLGSLSGVAGGLVGVKSVNDLYVGMLQSDTVAKYVIDKNNLIDRFEVETLEDAKNKLANTVQINSGKDSIISITYEDSDPKFAASVVESYIKALDEMLKKLALSDAAQQRIFYEKQLFLTRKKLVEAENQLKELQKTSGLIELGSQTSSAIEASAKLQAAIAERKVYLSRILSYATPSNSEAQFVSAEINQLEKQLRQMQATQNRTDLGVLSASEIPEAGLSYIRKLREVKFNESLLIAMEKQYEVVRLAEAEESSAMQLIDPPTPQDKKTKPARFVILIVALLLAIFSSFVLTIIHHKLTTSRRDDNLNYYQIILMILGK